MQAFPEVAKFELIDYKVRILDQGHGTDAITRVLIETSDGESSWVTVGVGHNVIEASWEALLDGLTFGLRRHHKALTGHPASVGRVSELHDLTALEQGDAVRRGEVSPRELVDHYLGRADDVGAFVTRTPELARERADALLPRARRRGPAVRRTDRDQGPQPDRRRPHDVRLARRTPTSCPTSPTASRCRSRRAGHGQPRQDQHPGVRLALLHRARRRCRRP